MASSTKNLDTLEIKLGDFQDGVIDHEGVTRVQARQHIELLIDAPIGKKHFFILVKNICALIVLECHFHLGLSKIHSISTTSGLYSACTSTSEFQFFKDKNSKTSVSDLKRSRIRVYCDLISKYPTFPVQILQRKKSEKHTLSLEKKGLLRGMVHYSYTYQLTHLENQPWGSLIGAPRTYTLELQESKKIQKIITKPLEILSSFNKFNLRRLSQEMNLYTDIKLTANTPNYKHSEWYEGTLANTRRKEPTLSTHSETTKIYKGKITSV